MRRVKLSWVGLEKHLQKADVILKEEEIKEVTLVKPRGVLLHLERRWQGEQKPAQEE